MPILKSAASILLIALLSANLFGYRVIFYLAEQSSDERLEASLDNLEYDEKQLLTIVVPLSVSYQVDQPEFERIDGEININGILYKYVKRKISNGELILKCIPHYNKMQLQQVKRNVIEGENDIAAKQQAGKAAKSTVKNIVSEYEEMPISITKSDYTISILKRRPGYAEELLSVIQDVPIKPPRLV